LTPDLDRGVPERLHRQVALAAQADPLASGSVVEDELVVADPTRSRAGADAASIGLGAVPKGRRRQRMMERA
jgi:hypothetical protein